MVSLSLLVSLPKSNKRLTKRITGYHVKFGMQYVNFTTGERYYKASFFEFVNAFKLYAEDPVVPVYVK